MSLPDALNEIAVTNIRWSIIKARFIVYMMALAVAINFQT